MGQLNVTDVRKAGLPAGRVKGFWIDAPSRGDQAGPVLRIIGWVIPGEIPMTGLTVFCQGTLLRVVQPDVVRKDAAAQFPGASEECGFEVVITALEVPAEFELMLVAVFKDRELVPLAVVSGRNNTKAVPEPAGQQFLQPLMVTSLGRSGTTYLMRLLAYHPKVVVDRTHPYEGNAARYWMHVARLLTQPPGPGHARREFDIGDFAEPPYVAAPVRRTPLLRRFLETDYPPIAAEFACKATDAFYRQVGEGNGQTDATYYCEKVLPSGLRFTLWNLYRSPREVFLVRDFRDVACSVFAFNAKRGEQGFGRHAVATDEAYIMELRQAARNLLETYRGYARRALLVRYEDLIHCPKRTLGKLLEYLSLEADPAVIASMMAQANEDTPQLEKHRTTSSPEASIGRWRQDLSPDLQQLCQKAFADYLPAFGYKLDKQGGLVIADSELQAR